MVELKSFENGFEYLELKNDAASAKIALQGAHVFEYKYSDSQDVFWLSENSAFELGSAIRGGVPLCWPAFGLNNPDLPQHGFARTSLFELVSSKELGENATEVVLRLRDSKESLELWNHKFELEFKVRVSDTLTMELKTTNLDANEFKLTQALHSYFRVSEISDAVVKGLKSKPRFDALTNKTFIQKEDISFKEEFDSVFQEVDAEIILEDADARLSVKNEGSSSVVVWNPWLDKCSRMSAMKPTAYREFVCVESANAFEDFKILRPNETHILKATILKQLS